LHSQPQVSPLAHAEAYRDPNAGTRADPATTRAKGGTARSTAARRAFQRQHPCPATGKPTGACPGYIVDHIIPLKRGGADSPSNMQWQRVADAKAKDRIE